MNKANNTPTITEEYNNFDPVTIGLIFKGLTDTGVGFYNAKKQSEIQKYVAEQDAKTQREIAKQMAQAKSNQEKIAILDELLKKKRRRENLPYYIGGGILGVAIIIGVVMILRKKK